MNIRLSSARLLYVIQALLVIIISLSADCSYGNESVSGLSDQYTLSSDLFSPQANKTYLPVSQAFQRRVDYTDNGNVEITITPAPRYYLYKSKFSLIYSDGSEEELNLTPGLKHTDDFMGTQEIYFRPVHLSLNLKDNAVLTFQGCTEGMCYPPQKISLQHNIAPSPEEDVKNNPSLISFSSGYQQNSGKVPVPVSSQIRNSFLFLLIGITLSLTPCVFPMYPVLSLILFGNRKSSAGSHTFLLSLFFVLGIAFAYTILGILAGLMGTKIHAFLQQPAILILFSLIFLLLSLSMLGLFELQMPSFITTYLQKVSERQKGGTYAGCFAIGIISAVVCSPCTTAPVSATLLYTIQQGEIFQGGFNLFLMGFGMGIPMLIIGALGKKVLPKAGAWMNVVKQVMGIFSLCVPLLLLDRFLPHYILSCGAVILSSAAIFIILRQINIRFTIPAALILISGSIFLCYGYITSSPASTSSFITSNLTHLTQELHKASENKQKVLIDFYASWCSSCKQYETETFADPLVKNELHNYLIIKVDLSDDTEENNRISSHFGLVGLPAVALIDPYGKTVILSGFYNSHQFLEELRKNR